MNTPDRYREIEVSGSPRELGRQIGESAGEEIRGFVEIVMSLINRTAAITHRSATRIATECISEVENYAPHLLEEMRGTAEVTGVSLEDLMLLQIRNQLTSDAESGCTSFSIAAGSARSGATLIGQNWDNDPTLDQFTIVLTRHPENKPSLMTLTQAGLISYIGMNDRGIAACLNTLPAPSRLDGVPHYFTLRAMYETGSLTEAAGVIDRAKRAIPANIMLATPDGPADLEVTIQSVSILSDSGDGRVTHTNHCLHPSLIAINDQFPELIQSRPRKERIDKLIRGSDERVDLEQLKAALRDHDGHPSSICRHPNDDSEFGDWTTVFSIIMEPESGTMHITRGTPCVNTYEPYTMPRT